MKLPKLLARNSLYDCSIGEERVVMVATQNLALRKSCLFYFAYQESYVELILATDLAQDLKLIFQKIMRLNQVPSNR